MKLTDRLDCASAYQFFDALYPAFVGGYGHLLGFENYGVFAFAF